MSSRAAFVLGALLCFSTTGCQRATRYPAVPALKAVSEDDKPAPLPTWSWQLPQFAPEANDLPIIFIAHGHKDWDQLRQNWNFQPRGGGTSIALLGQSPLAVVATRALTQQLEAIRIKVPFGLPDPTPNIPIANPPTFKKWELGKRIFFQRRLTSGLDTFACASCHRPEHGFGEDRSVTPGGTRNTPSLINVIFRRHQFWDGRATTLEEVLVRSLDDELPPAGAAPVETHRWGGLVRALEADIDDRLRFRQVFGLQQPTQDAVAKALATYMRTILSGNCLVDRAESERRRTQAPKLSAEHFAPLLDEAALQMLGAAQEPKKAAAQKLALGHQLFHDNGCATCHPAPLYTDHDFHNIGIGESELFRQSGQETGRFAHVPIGLKEARLIGAFRTPMLRSLRRTPPYFHDGSYPDLRTVVKYFNDGVHGPRDYLAKALQPDELGHGRSLGMSVDDVDALVMFLRALDGERVDPAVASAPK